MKYLFFFIIMLLQTAGAAGQSSICLAKAKSGDGIDYPADEVHQMLQLTRYKAIFFGEQHNTTFDPEIKYYLITDLHKRTGIRDVFLEMGFSRAWCINQYLETGDTTYLYNPAWPYSYSPYSLLWKRLRDYNKDLAAESKIVLHGVDFERTDVFRTIRMLTDKQIAVPPALQPMMDTITAHLTDSPMTMYRVVGGKMTMFDNRPFIRTLAYLRVQFLAHTDVARAYFGANFGVASDILLDPGLAEVNPKARNKTMFTAMKQIMATQKINRFIGFFGGWHTEYSVASSLTNSVLTLPGFNEKEVLNLLEVAYNIRQDDGFMIKVKNAEELAAINKDCRATLLPAAALQGYKRRADFVFVTDVSK